MQSRITGCLAVSLVLSASTARAQAPCTWQTVDDTTAAVGGAAPSDMLITPTALYVSGVAINSPTDNRWLLRRSENGTTWTTTDDHVQTAGVFNHPEAIVVTKDGTLLTVGGANDASQGGSWLTRSSDDGGNVWATADVFAPLAPFSGSARAATVDGNGVVLVGGHATTANAIQYNWLIRQSADDGNSWTTNDDRAPTAAGAGVTALATVVNGDVYASGWNWDGAQYKWQTRQRRAGQNQWTLVDNYVEANTGGNAFGAFPAAIATTRTRNVVLVGGTAATSQTTYNWTVRRTVNRGVTWATVDTVGPNCSLRGLVYDNTTRVAIATRVVLS
jgi:hypothetical protein